MSSNCAACLKDSSSSKALTCPQCQEIYHGLCVGITIHDMSKAQLTAWICPACCNKQPKGDNTNTPIRRDLSPSDNVTRRKRPSSDQCGKCLSRDDLSDIVRREVTNAINNTMKDSIKAAIAAQFKAINKKICDLEASVSFVSDQYEDFKNNIAELKPQIQILKEDNLQLKSTVAELSSRLTQFEQLSRASNAEIQCVPELDGENLAEIVKKLGTTMAHPVQEHEIMQCTRLAKQNSTSSRPRSVLVRFVSPRLRDSFLAATRKYNKENCNDKLNSRHLGITGPTKSPIYVVEHLSKEIKALHTAARLRAKEIGYEIVWVKHGRVFMRKADKTQHYWIKNTEMLSSLK